MQAENFTHYSRQIALNFLQTVVAVDDNIDFGVRQSSAVEDEVIVEPDEDEVASGVAVQPENAAENVGPLTQSLYYQELSLAFANEGVVCGGFTPEMGGDHSLQKIVNTSKNADITILDWQMNDAGVNGKLATETINEIAKNDFNDGGRLRLICIYTAENIADVIDSLLESLRQYDPVRNEARILLRDPNLTHWKIELISKNETSESELTKKLIDSFTELTRGLLSNAALAAISEVRDKTHHILHKLNPSLDSAYLSHVFGLLSLEKVREQCHEVAFDYAEELISDELKSLLQISKDLKRTLSEEVLNKWPEYINSADEDSYFTLEHSSNKTVSFGNARLHSLFSVKTDEEFDALKTPLNIVSIDKFGKRPVVFKLNNNTGSPLHDLCAIECQRRDGNFLPQDFFPALKLGTIIKLRGKEKYYLCLQPLCDSTRITETKSFLLLSVEENQINFTHVVKHKGAHIFLKIKTSTELITTVKFHHDPVTRAITARLEEEGSKLFYSAIGEFHEEEVIFDWIAEFKIGIATSIVNELSAKISRVGLDTFEWLRLK
jgi:hypothetical protein